MTSSYTSSNRLLKQGPGENVNTWGQLQSSGDFDMIDQALDGFATIALAGSISLTTQNALADQARNRMLQFTGTGAFTVTIPPVAKFYLVWNACSGALTISDGSVSAILQPGEIVGVVTDGGANIGRVQPSDFGGKRITSVATPTAATDAATKAYVDNAISTASISAGEFGVPITPGSNGKILSNDGSNPLWEAPTVEILTDYAADQAARATALDATAAGYATAAQTAAQQAAEAFAVCWSLLF